MPTVYITHPRCVEHHLPEHPEHAGRIRAVWRRIDESGMLPRLQTLQAEPATDDDIRAVHADDYLDILAYTAKQPYTLHLDADSYINPQSYEIARLSAGAGVMAVDCVLTGEADNGFVVTRPPGHHAISERGMGFCLLNNIAIAARHAQRVHRVERVLIVDYDVHHGNGTNDIFYNDPSVLFICTHQYPLYPMTGLVGDTGAGTGEGYTINIPMPQGCGDTSYQAVFEQVVIPAAQRYQPQLILVSAGYDAHWADPLAGMRLTLNGFAALGQTLKSLADTLCDGKIIFLMEGGYYVEALAHGMVNVGRLLLGDSPEDPLGEPDYFVAEPDINTLIADVRAVHQL
jgi:acetoin utilization deacetylase AcuC-like enzyme